MAEPQDGDEPAPEIARHLGISPATANTLLSQARKRLGVRTNAGLVRHAFREGWVSLDDPLDG